MGCCHIYCRQEPNLGPSLLLSVCSGMALGLHRLWICNLLGENLGLIELIKKTLVWKVHLLLLFLLGRFSRANHTTSPPSAPGTVHSLQVRRMQLTLASWARLLVQRWILELKEQLTAAKIQTLIYYCIMWETFLTPGKLECEGFPAKS